jgi:glycosyltransferase involved in cell wall biosynthesis
MNDKVSISAVVPVVDLFDSSGRLIHEYLEMLEQLGQPFEIVYVLDGAYPDLLDRLAGIAKSEPRLRVVQLSKSFGEANALAAGFSTTTGAIVLTLPAYDQVDTKEVSRVIGELDDCDMAVAVRSRKPGTSGFRVVRRRLYHWLIRVATGHSFSDMSCGVRAIKREVVEDLPLYGDQYRFFPSLVLRSGFRVKEVVVEEAEYEFRRTLNGPSDYLARILDIFAIVFLTRFTKKPLRFFGMIGSLIFAVGAVLLTYLVVQRLFFGVALADRPALLLTSLMVVLGLQVFALGLLGELIIFTHASELKEYRIERIIN